MQGHRRGGHSNDQQRVIIEDIHFLLPEHWSSVEHCWGTGYPVTKVLLNKMLDSNESFPKNLLDL